jgi:hypothetical protein
VTPYDYIRDYDPITQDIRKPVPLIRSLYLSPVPVYSIYNVMSILYMFLSLYTVPHNDLIL